MAYSNKQISNPYTGQSIRFLQTSADTAGRLLEMEARWEPRSQEPIEHYHPFQEEIFKVLAGELMVKINGRKKVLKAGEELHIQKNLSHTMWNDSETITVANWKVFPAMNTEQFLETAMGLAREGKVNKKGMLHILQFALMAKRYANIFRITRPAFIIQKIIFIMLSPFSYLAGYRSIYKKYLE
jgi:mannose-6-phosphate isomerase-like protein (cupin superfamily)